MQAFFGKHKHSSNIFKKRNSVSFTVGIYPLPKTEARTASE